MSDVFSKGIVSIRFFRIFLKVVMRDTTERPEGIKVGKNLQINMQQSLK